MAETDRPCRCRSRIMTTSPSLITGPSPPAGRDSIDDRSAARPPGARPGRSPLTASLGKIQTALLGTITPVSTASGWSIATTAGLVTFTTAPALDIEVTADFEFDVPVRFDTDHMAVTIETYRLHTWQQIPIVELRT
jgi:hypothetical protein